MIFSILYKYHEHAYVTCMEDMEEESHGRDEEMKS